MHIGGDFFCPARKLLNKIRLKGKFFRIFDEILLYHPGGPLRQGDPHLLYPGPGVKEAPHRPDGPRDPTRLRRVGSTPAGSAAANGAT